jgi:hypothetical protein
MESAIHYERPLSGKKGPLRTSGPGHAKKRQPESAKRPPKKEAPENEATDKKRREPRITTVNLRQKGRFSAAKLLYPFVHPHV